MSTYAVFGMTRHRAVEIARKDISRKLEKRRKGFVEQPVFERAVRMRASQIMKSDHVIQLSEKFDAPQYAREFLEIASRFESRHLHVKAYCNTGEKAPKTGRPIMRWIPEADWDEQAQKLRQIA